MFNEEYTVPAGGGVADGNRRNSAQISFSPGFESGEPSHMCLNLSIDGVCLAHALACTKPSANASPSGAGLRCESSERDAGPSLFSRLYSRTRERSVRGRDPSAKASARTDVFHLPAPAIPVSIPHRSRENEIAPTCERPRSFTCRADIVNCARARASPSRCSGSRRSTVKFTFACGAPRFQSSR